MPLLTVDNRWASGEARPVPLHFLWRLLMLLTVLLIIVSVAIADDGDDDPYDDEPVRSAMVIEAR